MPVFNLCLSAWKWKNNLVVIFPSSFILFLLFRTYFPVQCNEIWICISYICQLSDHAIVLWSRYLLLNQWRFYFECRDLNYTVNTRRHGNNVKHKKCFKSYTQDVQFLLIFTVSNIKRSNKSTIYIID